MTFPPPTIPKHLDTSSQVLPPARTPKPFHLDLRFLIAESLIFPQTASNCHAEANMSPSFYLKTLTLLVYLLVIGQLAGCTTTPVDHPLKTQLPLASKATTTPHPDVVILTDLNLKRHDPQVKVGRYRVLNAVPTEPQQQLLQVIIHVTLPEDLQTIRSAVEYLLPRSGYQLVTSTADRDVQQLLAKPLPAVHRQLGPMTLQNALAVLVGSAFQLQIDPVHRTVSYQLAPTSRVWSHHE